MTLLITVFAAIVATILWYLHEDSEMRLGTLALIYWGASLMWVVDAVAAYFEEGASYFQPAQEEMLNDAFLGLSAVALGLLIWLVIVLLRDPRHAVKKAFRK